MHRLTIRDRPVHRHRQKSPPAPAKNFCRWLAGGKVGQILINFQKTLQKSAIFHNTSTFPQCPQKIVEKLPIFSQIFQNFRVPLGIMTSRDPIMTSYMLLYIVFWPATWTFLAPAPASHRHRQFFAPPAPAPAKIRHRPIPSAQREKDFLTKTK